MKYPVLITVFAFVLLPRLAVGQDSTSDRLLMETVGRFGQAEVIIKYPGFQAMSRLAAKYSVSSCDGKDAALLLDPRTVSLFISERIPYALKTYDGVKAVYTASSVTEAMQWQSYPTWQQYDTIMHLLAGIRPDICILDTIGFSVMGRALLVLKISDNVMLDEQEPAVLLTASIHGDELAGFVLMMRLAEYLVSGSDDGGLIEKLISGLEIYINPLSNPDGMYRAGDTIINPTRSNINFYDLNRNYPDPEVTSPPPVQPETSLMITFMRENHFVLSANFHSGVEVVNYPWDKWTRVHADDQWFNEISRRYADTVHLNAAPGYMTYLDNGVTRGSVWYVVRGGRQDFVTYELGGREVTIEIHDTKQTPATELESLWNYNRRSFTRFLEEALFSVHGIVSDEETGDPLGAKVYIEGHDTDSSHVYTDTLTGKFIRYLSPGTWSITFTCDGYEPEILTDTEVEWNEVTAPDVKMAKVSTYPQPPETGLLIYRQPSAGFVRILPPETVSGTVTVAVCTLAGNIIRKWEETALAGIPIEADLSFLLPGVYILMVKKEPYGPVVRGKLIILGLV